MEDFDLPDDIDVPHGIDIPVHDLPDGLDIPIQDADIDVGHINTGNPDEPLFGYTVKMPGGSVVEGLTGAKPTGSTIIG